MPSKNFPPPLLRGRWHVVAKRRRDGGGLRAGPLAHTLSLCAASLGTSPITMGEEKGALPPCR